MPLFSTDTFYKSQMFLKLANTMDKFLLMDKLEGRRNWTSWKFDIDLQLSINKVKKIVTGELKMPVPLDDGADEVSRRYITSLKIYEDSDAMVKYIIGCSVRPEAKQHILTCNSGMEMWEYYTVYINRRMNVG
ncbi:hypothetical protein NQ314_000495 [Rhamnusium bicolor]|uniref:Uncharacterized protein n=1 Tax=Rhamnusium bicolor TaxID=1586634 RepID=A0AAV8ZV88_9CUCU|nr:hypothetical protein NQ314_000495 [Rhamnusium bicolor]